MNFGDLYVGTHLQDKDSIPCQDRLVIDISHELWLEQPKGIEQKIYSFGLSFGRMFEKPFSRSFSLAIGPSLRSSHHYSNAQFGKSWLSGTEKDTVIAFDKQAEYRINKLVLNYVDLNAEMRLKFGKHHNFKVYLGFRGGYLFNSHTKYVSDQSKYKVYRIDGATKLSYGPSIRIGIGGFCLFGHYLLQPVYDNQNKQTIKSVSLGISLLWL